MLWNNPIRKGLIIYLNCLLPAMCLATGNIISRFPSGTDICARSDLIYLAYVDVDEDPSTGAWVGPTWYPNETQVPLYPIQGNLNLNPPDELGLIRYSFIAADCNEPGWETKPGKFMIRFVDVNATGYVWNDPSTWQQMQVINAKLKLSHGDIYNYQVYNGPDDPGNILNPNPKIEVIAYESWDMVNEVDRAIGSGDHSLSGIDTGISELVFLTDFADSEVHYIELSMISEPEPINPGTDGLVASYALDGDATDSSGNGNDGIINNADTGGLGDGGSVWVDDSERGTVISFNGTAEGAFVRAGEIPQMTLTNDFTWSFWAKQNAENTANNDIILGNRMDENAVDFVPRQFIKFTPTKFEWHMNGNGDDNMEYDDIPADIWLHHAVVKSGDQLTYYRNGAEGGSGIITQPLDFPQPLFFGGDNEGSAGENWSGLMSDVAIYDRALSTGEVMFLAGFRPGPVAHYKLDDGEGIIAVDSSGNGNDGILVGTAISWMPNDGIMGGALSFDGTASDADYVEISTADISPAAGTIAMWGKLGSDPQLPATRYFVGHTTIPAWSNRIQLYMDNSDTILDLGLGDSHNRHKDIMSLATETWYHVALTWDVGNYVVYVNGQEKANGSYTGLDTLNTVADIGNDGNTDGRTEAFNGLLDDVRIYDRALSSDEVSELAGKAVDPSLVIYYDFDEVGDIVADQSGKGHDGVVVGDVTAEAEGMIGGAANFANGGYLDLDGPSIPAEDIPTSAMTLAAWIKIANTGGDHEIFSARASDESWLIHPEPKSSGDIRWLLRSYGGTTIFQIRAGTVTWDQWLHFAGTYDKESGKAALYINGELIEEIVVENPADIAGDWDLGARVGLTIDDGRPFTGLMDEFRMYTRALSQDEILEIMQGK